MTTVSARMYEGRPFPVLVILATGDRQAVLEPGFLILFKAMGSCVPCYESCYSRLCEF